MNPFTILKAQNDIVGYIKDNISIEETAQKLKNLNLKKVGRLLEGDCPTNHPSESGTCFKVFLESNSCHCFNCGHGGSVIDLVMMAENLSFKEALEWIISNFSLGSKFNLSNLAFKSKSEEELKKEKELRQKSLLLEEVILFGNDLLYQEIGADALRYLTEDRKYDVEILSKTEFIYLPPEPEVKKHLLNVFPAEADAIRSLKLTGRFGDNFRLAFPYRNSKGIITGLLKRVTEPKGIDIITYDGKEHLGVRWDSTPGTTKEDLFRICECKDLDTLLIVEGYPDAIYLSALGQDNIVAVGQGRLSKAHLEGLNSKKVKNVIISFDNDEVGPVNTESAVRLLLEESEITPFVLDPKLLNPHKDPDEYVKANGIDAFRQLLSKTEKGLFWLCRLITTEAANGDPVSKQSATDKLFSLAQYITDPIEMAEFIEVMKKQMKTSESAIKARIKSEKEKGRIEQYQKLKQQAETGDRRYVPFIEKSTSSYAYYDFKEDEVYLGVSYQILDNIMASAEQQMPEVLPVLKADFYIEDNNRIDYEKERFNFFVPTRYMLLSKTQDKIDPRSGFPHVYKVLSNLFPNYRERKLFLNWLAGILQFRKKHITAWLLKGVQGTGKNALMERVLEPIFGHRQTKIVDDADLQRDFNPWLQNAILIAFNEVAHDNKTRNSINSKIKAIISDPTATINEKNVKTYTVKNHTNCLFFSNESIPLFIEQGDRRFNVVSTGEKLNTLSWFNYDPEGYLRRMEDEVPQFAQFLMNWKYDSIKANTCINNEEKVNMVDACMNRYEKFAHSLKQADIEWFKESIPNFLKNSYVIPEKEIKGKKIPKESALSLFNEIYSETETKTRLTQRLKDYGINVHRDRTNDQHLYIWN